MIVFTDEELAAIRSALEFQAARMERDLREAGDKAPLWLILQIAKTKEQIKKMLEKL